jgi:hypothetical protein
MTANRGCVATASRNARKSAMTGIRPRTTGATIFASWSSAAMASGIRMEPIISRGEQTSMMTGSMERMMRVRNFSREQTMRSAMTEYSITIRNRAHAERIAESPPVAMG